MKTLEEIKAVYSAQPKHMRHAMAILHFPRLLEIAREQADLLKASNLTAYLALSDELCELRRLRATIEEMIPEIKELRATQADAIRVHFDELEKIRRRWTK